MKFDMIPEN